MRGTIKVFCPYCGTQTVIKPLAGPGEQDPEDIPKEGIFYGHYTFDCDVCNFGCSFNSIQDGIKWLREEAAKHQLDLFKEAE